MTIHYFNAVTENFSGRVKTISGNTRTEKQIQDLNVPISILEDPLESATEYKDILCLSFTVFSQGTLQDITE